MDGFSSDAVGAIAELDLLAGILYDGVLFTLTALMPSLGIPFVLHLPSPERSDIDIILFCV